MDHLLLNLEIDAACWEFLASRILALGGPAQPQPVVLYIEAPPDEEDSDWGELTAKLAAAAPALAVETTREMTERMLTRMEG
jgi:hypothetical protein